MELSWSEIEENENGALRTGLHLDFKKHVLADWTTSGQPDTVPNMAVNNHPCVEMHL